MRSKSLRKLILGLAGIVISSQILLNGLKLIDAVKAREFDKKRVSKIVDYNSVILSDEF